MKLKISMFIITLALFIPLAQSVSAHCDTMDGPLIADARMAIEQNNVNYVLKWIKADDEKEIIRVFTLAMKVRSLNEDAKQLADSYFFDVLVRIHRTGEGESFTGVKPHGSPIDETILAADRAIETGDLAPLEKLIPKKKIPRLRELYNNVMRLKKFDVNNVKKGREYIEAYVNFFKYAEGEEGHHHEHGH